MGSQFGHSLVVLLSGPRVFALLISCPGYSFPRALYYIWLPSSVLPLTRLFFRSPLENSHHLKIFLPKKLLECLPRCPLLPPERLRWNTNEVFQGAWGIGTDPANPGGLEEVECCVLECLDSKCVPQNVVNEVLGHEPEAS